MSFYLTFCLFFPELSKTIPRKREQIPCCYSLMQEFPNGSIWQLCCELPAQPFLPGSPEKLLSSLGSLSGDVRFERTSAANPTCLKLRRRDSSYHETGKKSISLRIRRATWQWWSTYFGAFHRCGCSHFHFLSWARNGLVLSKSQESQLIIWFQEWAFKQHTKLQDSPANCWGCQRICFMSAGGTKPGSRALPALRHCPLRGSVCWHQWCLCKFTENDEHSGPLESSSFQTAASLWSNQLSLLELANKARACMNIAWATQPGPSTRLWCHGQQVGQRGGMWASCTWELIKNLIEAEKVLLRRTGRKERLRSLGESAEPAVMGKQANQNIFFLLRVVYKDTLKGKGSFLYLNAQTLCSIKNILRSHLLHFSPPPLPPASFPYSSFALRAASS